MTDVAQLDVAVIGAGLAGICAGIKLRETGLTFLRPAGGAEMWWRSRTFDLDHYDYTVTITGDTNERHARQPAPSAYQGSEPGR